VLVFGEFELDRTSGTLTRAGAPIVIRRKLWQALCLLVERRGQLVPASELRAAVWPNTAVSERGLGNLIHELRKAIGDSSESPRYIATVPARGFRFVAPVAERFVAPSMTRFVGRVEELARIRGAFAESVGGKRGAVVIAGEAGSGKSHLIDRFRQGLATSGVDRPLVAVGRCVARAAGPEAYLPIFDLLDSCKEDVGVHTGELVELLRTHAPRWAEQIPWADESSTTTALSSVEARPERMLREIAAFVEAMAKRRPVVLIVEDLHWADPATLELLTYLARRTTRARILLVVSSRHRAILEPGHPDAGPSLAAWENLTSIELKPLVRAEVHQWLCEAFAGSPDVVDRILDHVMRRSAGNPLFVNAITRLLIDRGVVERHAAGWNLRVDIDLDTLAPPAEVGELVAQQWERVAPAARRLLDVAAVAGEEFDAAAVAGALDDDLEIVDAELRQQAAQAVWIQHVGVSSWPDGTTAGRYRFVHALYRDAVYGGIPSARRSRLHRALGMTLERGFAPAPQAAVATLAEHFHAGGDHPRAADYLERTAVQMIGRSAIRDAREFYRRALGRIELLPEGPERWVREVRVRTGYGITSAMVDGLDSPILPEIYAAVSRLVSRITDPDVLFPTLRVFWVLELLRFGYVAMTTLDTRLRAIADANGNPAYRALAASMTGTTFCFLGNLHQARRHLEDSLQLCDDATQLPPPNTWITDPRVESRCVLAWVLWLMGEADHSRAVLKEAGWIARDGGHESSRGLVSWFRSSLAQLDGDAVRTRAAADELTVLAERTVMPVWSQIATVVRALAALAEGDSDALEVGLASMAAVEGSPTMVIARAYLLGQLAVAYGQRGEVAHGLALVDMALARIAENSARVSEADLVRIRGELLESMGEHEEAARAYDRAAEIARTQGARLFELRAAIARLRLQQGVRPPAPPTLESAHAELRQLTIALSAGGDSHDLRIARQLLAIAS